MRCAYIFFFLTTFILCAVLATSVLGFFMVSGMGHEGALACPLPQMAVKDCAVLGNAMAVVEHHISTIHMLLAAVLAAAVTGVVLVSARLFQTLSLQPPKGQRPYSFWDDNQRQRFTRIGRLLQWLAALHADPDASFLRVSFAVSHV